MSAPVMVTPMEALSRAAQRISAEFVGTDAVFNRVISDTRQLQRGDLFVALVGEHHDGHDFLRRAASLGAAGALVSRRIDTELPQILVPDTLRGLQDYARAWRSTFSAPLIGVTGSNGKTTTKQLLAAVLAARGPVLATEGNLNNHIGVPLTLARLRAEHRSAVIEMGANHPHEIAQLASLARPDIGIVTQAGDAHLEGFGTREGVARSKGELFTALGARGTAVINADDAYAALWRDLAGLARKLTFGFAAGADVRAENVQSFTLAGGRSGSRFMLITPSGRAEVELPLPGRHNIANALAAAACGVALDMDAADIAAGLGKVQGAAGRVDWKTTLQGARLIDDSYNANPTSLRAGLELLAAQKGRRWAVLGGMAELGPTAPELHEAAGRAARDLGIDRLYAQGALAAHYARGYGSGAKIFDDTAALIAAIEHDLKHELKQDLKKEPAADVTLLVKGSRSARMDAVVQALVGTDPANNREPY
ncbi:MAG: UDP-N-acetylmuramoyl-tripeptide--D-alanyl-D-alanine ligase [Hydrocarboniphaga sp.]|uniref:UDP-N-acetylmuramoyl-tripeptide--D-alanyl-D- alanine ligase n=1 Tax=Hydrocarboniphaga sp. TaxID=2033016 RepID=UPI00261DF980|nr:UDP-N-acetylmuramoyl-tripeptide--D-alanyl-D-alanine ligase [Hydrocarboniphaga sp.]MDB5969570.1 UDP-N-acetylmuramoyl-tripeptide--D-alanyl-D-alanine ligase [Hydrocarboniphaga sp.]